MVDAGADILGHSERLRSLALLSDRINLSVRYSMHFPLPTWCEVSHSQMMSFEERRRGGYLRALLSSTRLLPFGFRLATRSVRGSARELEKGDGSRTREVSVGEGNATGG